MYVMTSRRYDLWYKELCEAVKELQPYYDIDKIKPYSVYVWSKPNNYESDNVDDWGVNLFDICEDRIIYYVDGYTIPNEVMPIIENIQHKLGEYKYVHHQSI